VCDLETSRIGAPYIYIYDISRLRVNITRQKCTSSSASAHETDGSDRF